MTTRLRATAFVLLLAAGPVSALSGCSTNPATGEQSFTAFMSPEEELRVGRDQDPKIKQQFGGSYTDAELEAYVSRIGKQLAATSELPDLEFHFTLLNTPDINAFALPGGYVYVTRGLIALAGNEAELAGVIAHEIGHVTARHSAQRYSHSVAVNIGATILGILADSRAVSDIASLGADLYLKGYSREQEFEADTLGVRYLSRAGYDTGAMASFLERMGHASRLRAEMAGSNSDPDAYDLLSTHPRTVDRVQQAQAAAHVGAAGTGRTGRDAFLDQLDGVMFGDDPKEGLVRDREFVHRDLGFRFEVPPGFQISNRPSQVLAADKQGTRFVFDRAPRGVRAKPLAYIGSSWAKGHRLRDPESITINDMEAATAWLPVTAQNNAAYILRLVAVRFDADTIYRMQFLVPQGRIGVLSEDLRRTTYSFRRLSDAERANVRPHRIQVVRFREGESPAELASGIPFPGFELRFFEVINGLPRGAAPAPGARIKTIGTE